MPHRWSPFRPPQPFVVPVHLDPAGGTGPTPGAARGPRWEKTSPGFYVPAGTDRIRPEQRIVEAMCGLPDTAALTGWGSIRMHGEWFLDGQARGRRLLPVQVRLPPGVHPRPRPGVRFVEGPIPAAVEIRGLRCLPIVVAVGDVRRYVDARPSWRGVPGVPQLRRALELASDRSASPPETRLRLVWELDAGLPAPLVNVPVYDRAGRLLGVPDLLDPVAGLAVEYDGDDHRDPHRHSEDVDREARFRGVGLEVTRVTGRDLRRTPELVDRLHTARRRAGFQPVAARAWVIGR